MNLCILPERLVSFFVRDSAKRASWNVLLSSVLALLAVPFVARLTMLLEVVPHFCLLDELFGVRCPGCGITRSIVALSQGHLEASFNFNPAGIALVIGTLVQAGFQLAVLALHMSPALCYRGTRGISLSVLIAIVGSWSLYLLA